MCPYKEDLAIIFSQLSGSIFLLTPSPDILSITNLFQISIPLGERKAVGFDNFHSGYRLAAAFVTCDDACDRYASVTWTSLKAHETRTLSNSSADFFACK